MFELECCFLYQLWIIVVMFVYLNLESISVCLQTRPHQKRETSMWRFLAGRLPGNYKLMNVKTNK